MHAFLASNTVTNEYYPELARILFQSCCRVERKKPVLILNSLTYPVVLALLTDRSKKKMI